MTNEHDASPTPPPALAVLAENIPEELQALNQWVGWRWWQRKDSESWTKPPVDPMTGRLASVKARSTWSTFANALGAYTYNRDSQNGSRVDGVGFMFVHGGGLVGVDLDKCADAATGHIEPWARAIIDQVGSYSEFSASGTGVKLVCRATLPEGKTGTNKPHGWPVEVYASGRYFTLTGHHVPGTPAEVREAQAAVLDLWQRIHTTKPQPDGATEEGEKLTEEGDAPAASASRLSDEDVIGKAGAAVNGDKFGRLFIDGDASEYRKANGEPDHSRADMALLDILAFWCGGDAAQMERIARRSKLARDKWDERHYSDGRTYLQHAIDEALQRVPQRYDPTYRSNGGELATPTTAGGSATSTANGTAGEPKPAPLPAKPAATPAPRFNVHSLKDAMQPQPAETWIVERLFTPGSVSVVVGEPGSKKTWSVLDLAICVAMGQPWLGLLTLQGPVLIVDEESGERRLSRRLGAAARGHFATEDTPLYYTCLSMLDLRKPTEADQLRALITELGAHLVIIDALADVMPGGDENMVRDVQPMMMQLRTVADTTQTAIVLIHHAAKNGGAYRGSSAIKGAVDTMLTAQSEPDETVIRFGFEKSRDVEPFKFAAEAHFSDGLFWLTETRPTEESDLSASQAEVLSYLKTNGPAQTGDILRGCEMGNDDTARRTLYRLRDRGFITVTSSGSGKSNVWSLPFEGGERV